MARCTPATIRLHFEKFLNCPKAIRNVQCTQPFDGKEITGCQCLLERACLSLAAATGSELCISVRPSTDQPPRDPSASVNPYHNP